MPPGRTTKQILSSGILRFETSLDFSFFGTGRDLGQAKRLDDLVCDCIDSAISSLNSGRSPGITFSAGFVQFAKLLWSAQQRTLGRSLCSLLRAALPQLLDWGVEKDSWNAGRLQQRGVSLLDEGSATQGDDPATSATQLFQEVFECGMLGAPEFQFPRIAENRGDGAAFATLNAVIQILEYPIQTVAKEAPYAALARSHETDQEDGVGRLRPLHMTAPHTGARINAGRFARTLLQTSFLFCGTFTEVDFTTEAAQNYRRGDGRTPHGTPEGTSFFKHIRHVLPGLEVNIVMHFATNRAGTHVGRGGVGDNRLDVAAVAGEAGFAAISEITDVIDAAAGRNHLDQGTRDLIESDLAAQGVDLHVAVLHVGDSDRPVQGFNVDMGIGDVPNLNRGAGAFEGHVTAKFFGVQGTGAGVQRHAGIGWNQNFVFNATGAGIGPRQQVGNHLDTIPRHGVVHRSEEHTSA